MKIRNKVDDFSVDFPIDLLITWVNSEDIEWQKAYAKETNTTFDPGNARFRNLIDLKYLLRSIDINMSWINKVHLIVASESQVPDWLNRDNVDIILHSDYIPSEFLPTFNSNTIESFMPEIKGLPEHIIYGNDDVYVMNKTSPLDFFDKNGKPKIAFDRLEFIDTDFFKMSKKCFDMVRKDFPDSYYKSSEYAKQRHVLISWTKSTLNNVFNNHKTELIDSITSLRDYNKNFCQYIFADYEILSGNYITMVPDYIGKCLPMIDMNVTKINNEMFNCKSKTLCINDSGFTNTQVIEQLNSNFEKIFPEKSKFEN